MVASPTGEKFKEMMPRKIREPIRDLERAGFTSRGRTVEEYYDPQFSPVNKPNFYIYMVHEGDCFFAVHLHQPFPFANRVAKHYNKAEITSAANSQNKALSPAILFDDPDFIAAIEKPIAKTGFFKAREKQYLNYAKRL